MALLNWPNMSAAKQRKTITRMKAIEIQLFIFIQKE